MDSLTCSVCGHKQLKIATWPLCFTHILPDQQKYSRCGNPTIYKRTDMVKKMTPDIINHTVSKRDDDFKQFSRTSLK